MVETQVGESKKPDGIQDSWGCMEGNPSCKEESKGKEVVE